DSSGRLLPRFRLIDTTPTSATWAAIGYILATKQTCNKAACKLHTSFHLPLKRFLNPTSREPTADAAECCPRCEHWLAINMQMPSNSSSAHRISSASHKSMKRLSQKKS